MGLLGRGTGAFSVGKVSLAISSKEGLIRRFSVLMLRMYSRDGLFLCCLALRNATWVLSFAAVLSSTAVGLIASNDSNETVGKREKDRILKQHLSKMHMYQHVHIYVYIKQVRLSWAMLNLPPLGFLAGTLISHHSSSASLYSRLH